MNDDTKFLVAIICFVVCIGVFFGGMIYALQTYVDNEKITVTQTEQIIKMQNLELYNARMDSPLVVIKLDTLDELITVAKNDGHSIIYKVGTTDFATIVNSTIGYKYTVTVDGPSWWVW